MNELELLNQKVAEKAGWIDIHEWSPNPKYPRPRKSYKGTNPAHPELGAFIPNYVEDLTAIAKVFTSLGIEWTLSSIGHANTVDPEEIITSGLCDSPAIALCQLLINIDPEPIKPKVECEKCKTAPRDFQAEAAKNNSGVIEVSFG